MATTSTRLKMYYLDPTGAEVLHSWNHVDSSKVTAERVKALATAEIAGTSIYQKDISSLSRAETVTTTTTELDIS